MTEQTKPAFKPKKSVALSGTAAGNTAVCTVGRTGNDLHYRGYDILEFAEHAEFEEIAHLIVHGTLPNKAELKKYKAKLKSLRGLPAAVMATLESIPPSFYQSFSFFFREDKYKFDLSFARYLQPIQTFNRNRFTSQRNQITCSIIARTCRVYLDSLHVSH